MTLAGKELTSHSLLPKDIGGVSLNSLIYSWYLIMSMGYVKKCITLTLCYKRLKKLTVPDLHSTWTLTTRCHQEKEVGQEI